MSPRNVKRQISNSETPLLPLHGLPKFAMKITKIDSKHLSIGMYVTKLDRSWLETPFAFQGFRIETERQLQRVRDICEYVYIDEEKSDRKSGFFSMLRPSSAESAKTLLNTKDNKAFRQHKTSFEEEFPLAREIYERSTSKLRNLMDNFRLSKAVDSKEIKAVVTAVMESVAHNSDALLLLSNLKSKTQDTVRHSINVCIVSLVFGRYLGLPEKRLSDLGFAALLHDVGEVSVSADVLAKHNRGLTPEERKAMEMHTVQGADILRNNPGIPSAAIEVALTHHERIDGKGYPRGLHGPDLSLLAKIVSIVDVFESVTNNPGSKIQVSCSDALRSIYSMRDTFFDGELVEKFIKCLGIYPVGSVVELNSREVGIVISLKPDKHLLPTLMIVRNKEGKPCYPPHIINLDNFKTEEGNPQYFIIEVLEPNAFGIDLSDIIIREAAFLQAGTSGSG